MSKTISIEGMMCQHCVAHVTKALTEVPGVTSVNVSLEHKNAVVTGSADDKALNLIRASSFLSCFFDYSMGILPSSARVRVTSSAYSS